MNENIKAIETRYKGHRFRSRLEARWAVFFDAMGIEWIYEPEGYETDIGPYLPDFILPKVNLRTTKDHGGMWMEIKPVSPTREEKDKLIYVAEATKRDAGFLVGPPTVDYCPDHEQVWPWGDCPMVFVHCEKCNRVKFEFSEGNYMKCDVCNLHASSDSSKLYRAVEKALSARFGGDESYFGPIPPSSEGF